MKILVYEEPIKPNECLFYNCEYSTMPYSGDVIRTYLCNVDGKTCVLNDENNRCDKLMPLKISRRM